MKKIPLFILLAAALLMVGCTPSISQGEEGDPISVGKPIAQVQKPRIPQSGNFKASVLGSTAPDETQKLLDAIEKKIAQPNIMYEDIERGWYYGSLQEKKVGTPSTWTWVENGKSSRWMSPNAMEEETLVKADELCKKTAGTYVISCIENEAPDCEYIPTSTCRCVEGSEWDDKQGCILTDEKKGFVVISDDELKRGWYLGLPNQKKLNTPFNWVWVEAGENSRWQNPNPLD
ncbi:MAG: hypothetical protein V1908_00565 [Candidatus Peregrinibacteria bacterium]